jgi:hypothetical protein
MSEPTYDPIKYLELLDDHITRETARVRRNVAVLSFGIVLVHLLKVPLDRLALGGVPVAKDHELLATAIAAALLLYWCALFAIRYLVDTRRRAERHAIVADAMSPLRERQKVLRKQVAEGAGHAERRELRGYDRLFARYEDQQKRTSLLARLLRVGLLVEWLPTAAVAVLAVALLASRLYSLLSAGAPGV